MSRTSKYYLPQAIANTERKLAELRLQQEVAIIDQQLEILKNIQSLYPSHKADGEQPSALHTAVFPS